MADGAQPGDDDKTVVMPPDRYSGPPQPAGPYSGQAPGYPQQPPAGYPAGPPQPPGYGGPQQPPYPPQQWYPPAPNRGGHWKWIALTAVGVVVLVAAVLVIARSGGDKAPPPPAAKTSSAAAPTNPATSGQPQTPTGTTAPTSQAPGTIGADGLGALLLTQGEIQDKLNESVAVVGNGTAPVDQAIDRTDCGGVLLMPTTNGLAGANQTGVTTQLLRDPSDPGRLRVFQWAIAFPDGPAAGAFLANSYERWKACGMKTVSLTEEGTTSQWTVSFAQLSTSGTQLSVLGHQQGAGDWWCQQAGMARGNVVVGAQVCKSGTYGNAIGLASVMAKKVPQ